MITAEFFRSCGTILGFEVSGHADFGEYGNDIACASVSSAVQYTANLITETFGFAAEISAENDAVVLKAESFGDSIIQKIFSGFIMQLELISQEFEGTIRIKFTEV